jgi:CHAT domain-containing protein
VRRSIREITISFFTLALLLGVFSCKAMLPVPPASPVKIEIQGPYDIDIPEKFAFQLKSAGRVFDAAVPHVFINIGMHFESIGDERRAIHFFTRAATEFRRRGDIKGEGTVLGRMVVALTEFGRMQDAYNAIEDAEKRWRNTPLVCFVYHNYGHYFLIDGDYDKALHYFRKSLQSNINFHHDINLLMLRRDSELDFGSVLILSDYFPAVSKKINLLDFDETIYSSVRKNVDEFALHLQQVILLNDEIRKTKIGKYIPETIFEITESKAHNFLALYYGIKGQFSKAMKHLDASAPLARKANFRIGEVDNLFFRSLIHLLEKNLNDGLKAARQFNEIADKYHLPFYQISAKFILSHYCRGIGDNFEALRLLSEAISISEKQRYEPRIDAVKVTSPFNEQMLYDSLIELLAKEGNYKKAFETAERAKSRDIIDMLAGKDIGKNAVDSERIKENRKYVNEIADDYRKMLSISGGGDLALKKALDRIRKKETEHSDGIFKFRMQNEELYSLLSIEPVNNEDIRRLLDKNTTLFSYYVSDKILYIWAVNRDRVHLERIGISREEIFRIIAAFNVAIASGNKKQVEAISEDVYEMFLKPVIPFVSGDWIGFVPHGPLHYLPFAAMSYKGQYLGEGFSIFYLPGAGVLKYEMKKRAAHGWKVLAFGNPDLGNRELDLPYAEMEVASIKKIIPETDIFLRAEATKNKAMEMVGNYDIVHFATRGLLNGDLPVNSGLQLARGGPGDGRLTTAEIFKLRFNGRLVVASGCRVVPGISGAGTEITGFNRALLYAGTPSAVTTLWRVEDKATAVFMKIFYNSLLKNETVADSLREAQVEMIHRGYAPYYWAAFVLSGIY